MMLGNRIKEIRLAFGWSQVELARRLNISKQTVSNWENGYAEPEEDLLPDIASFFGVKIRDLTSDLPLAG